MRTVTEFRDYARQCRDMAARMDDAADRRSLELQAQAWDKVADARETALVKGKPPELV